MPRVKMSLSQYAAEIKRLKVAGYRGKQAVQYRIKRGLPLRGVIKREVVLGRNVLTVDIDTLESKAGKRFGAGKKIILSTGKNVVS